MPFLPELVPFLLGVVEESELTIRRGGGDDEEEEEANEEEVKIKHSKS